MTIVSMTATRLASFSPGQRSSRFVLYLKDNRAKVEIGLARGKREYDKREAIAERDSKRSIERELRERLR